MKPFFPALRMSLSCLCLIAPFAMVPQAAIAGSAVPKVLVSIAPLQPVADAILAGITHSSVLARPGQDPHGMILSPSQAEALASAEIIIVPDRKMSSIVNNLATRYEKNGTLVIALDELPGAEPLPYMDAQPWLGADDENKDAKKKDKADEKKSDDEKPVEALNDPHLWMDPLRMAAIAKPLADAIGNRAPSLRGRMEANAEQWSMHLTQQLHPLLKKVLTVPAPKPRFDSRPYIPFVTGHSAFQYFLGRYGISDPGALGMMPEETYGARSSHDVQARAGKVTIGCLIAEQETARVKRVATASNARIVILNPELLPSREGAPVVEGVKDDYDRLLYETAQAFAHCL